jgi:hypothetical protein
MLAGGDDNISVLGLHTRTGYLTSSVMFVYRLEAILL